MWIDTHTHIYDDAFQLDRSEVVGRCDGIVDYALVIGIDIPTSQMCLSVADSFPNLFAVVGIQPNSLCSSDCGTISDVRRLAAHHKVVAIGETGLDNYWKKVPIETQRNAFLEHIQLARELEKPIVIHCREAEEDTWQLLLQYQRENKLSEINGVMHSYCGSAEYAKKFLDIGLHISLSGMVTYKKNTELRDMASKVPLNRILVETDCPYLAPEPFRGKRNEPAHVQYTGKVLAQTFGLSDSEFARITSSNAKRLFRLP